VYIYKKEESNTLNEIEFSIAIKQFMESHPDKKIVDVEKTGDH
jgi:hypothetical protein